MKAHSVTMSQQAKSPHIRSYSGNLRDYNGVDNWSAQEVRKRYTRYCDLQHVREPLVLMPVQHQEGDVIWIYPIMWEVIRGIQAGDQACMAIGVEFVEEDELFVFGRLLKANTARALRRAQLPEDLKARLRQRIVSMLLTGMVPREVREYWKLLRDIGVGADWPRLEANVPRDNPFAMRFYNRLRSAEGLPMEN